MSTLIIYQNILLITIGKAIPITIEEPTKIQSLLLTLKIFCSNIPSIKIHKTTTLQLLKNVLIVILLIKDENKSGRARL